MRNTLFWILVASYTVVHVHFEYVFWLTPGSDIFGKYAAATSGEEIAVAKRVYFTKATWMIVLVWLQCLRVDFKSALAWSFLLYSVELMLFFPVRIYTLLNLFLAMGCVAERLLIGRRLLASHN